MTWSVNKNVNIKFSAHDAFMELPSTESYLWNNPHQKVIYGITLIRKLFMEQPSSESYLWNNPHQKVIYGTTLIRKLFME